MDRWSEEEINAPKENETQDKSIESLKHKDKRNTNSS